MKKVKLFDNAAANALGWNPDGFTTGFTITEPLADSITFGSNVIANVGGRVCATGFIFSGTFQVFCDTGPADGSALDYTIINLPPLVPS